MTGKIKIQTQGSNECFPTSVCMVAGVEWASVRPVIEEELTRCFGSVPVSRAKNSPSSPQTRRRTWGDTRGYDRDIAVRLLVDYLGLPGYTERAGKCSGAPTPRGRIPKYEIPTDGVGFIVLRNATHRVAHVAAYEDGFVYDPAWTTPRCGLSSDLFNALYRKTGWRVDFILSVDPREFREDD